MSGAGLPQKIMMQIVESIGIMGKSEQCGNTALTLNDLTGGHQLPDQDSSTRLIPLSQGKVALVDAADYEWLSRWKWYAAYCKKGKRWYACRNSEDKTQSFTVHMHREILQASCGSVVDHKDGDGLNNQRSNLRMATRSQNQGNSKLPRHNTSGYKGVIRSGNKWIARLTTKALNGKSKHLGSFNTPEEAHEAYVSAAKEYFGEFARP